MTQILDVIKIFRGMDIPFVVRPVTAELLTSDGKYGDKQARRYRLISDTYVDGIMGYGGAANSESEGTKLTEQELRDIEDFLLE